MTFISKLLHGADARPFDTLEDRAIAAHPVRADEPTPAPPEPKAMVAKVAEAYLKAHRDYSRAEIELTRQIDALVEERRQMRVAIATTEAALYPLAEDAALSPETKQRVATIFKDAVRTTIDGADLQI